MKNSTLTNVKSFAVAAIFFGSIAAGATAIGEIAGLYTIGSELISHAAAYAIIGAGTGIGLTALCIAANTLFIGKIIADPELMKALNDEHTKCMDSIAALHP